MPDHHQEQQGHQRDLGGLLPPDDAVPDMQGQGGAGGRCDKAEDGVRLGERPRLESVDQRHADVNEVERDRLLAWECKHRGRVDHSEDQPTRKEPAVN